MLMGGDITRNHLIKSTLDAVTMLISGDCCGLMGPPGPALTPTIHRVTNHTALTGDRDHQICAALACGYGPIHGYSPFIVGEGGVRAQ